MRLPKHVGTVLLGGIIACGIAATAAPARADSDYVDHRLGLDVGLVWLPQPCTNILVVDPVTGQVVERADCPPPTVVSGPVPPEPVLPLVSGGSNSARTTGAKTGTAVLPRPPARPTKSCGTNAGC